MSTIRTPHAAIKIWNYIDRVTDMGADASKANQVHEEIVSTISCVAIQTSKTKGEPVGSFSFVLAPTRNWVSVITPGSWCAVMMSNEPITKHSFEKANKSLIKMFGRIETVRVEVSVDDDGARQTKYLISGQDWCGMFNNSFYVDPLIADPSDQQGQQANALYQQLVKYVLSSNHTPTMFSIPGNLQTLLSIFGSPLANLPDTNRLAKATHNIAIPDRVLSFFGFIDSNGNVASNTDLTKIITLQTGALTGGEGAYNSTVNDGKGWLDPFSMVGSHTLWSLMMDNNNHALNELYPEMRWVGNRPQLTLYNRIRPFSFQANPIPDIDSQLRSKFQNVVTHKLDNNSIISVNAGTNWRDKFNFLEIKPDLAEFKVYDAVVKQKSQAYQKHAGGAAATDVFDREGFRPLIFSVKQLPLKEKETTIDGLDVEQLNKWVNLLQEWYFDSHRLLNGRLVMTGSTEYIPVGDNILFEAELIGLKHNYNSGATKHYQKNYILAHVEGIQHNFSVGNDGARQFQTVIQFVRGIIVDAQKHLVGGGTIDTYSTDLRESSSQNSITVVATKTSDNIPGGS